MAGGYDVQFGTALQAFPGSGHIQDTSAHLRLAPRLGPMASIEARLSERASLQLAGNEASPRASLRDGEASASGKRIRVVPLSLSLVERIETRGAIAPYVGAGVIFPLVRRALDVVALPSMQIVRIEEPDHGALVLQAGARTALSQRWWLGVDAKIFPAESTLETHRAARPRASQTNFHPLIVSTGMGLRF